MYKDGRGFPKPLSLITVRSFTAFTLSKCWLITNVLRNIDHLVNPVTGTQLKEFLAQQIPFGYTNYRVTLRSKSSIDKLLNLSTQKHKPFGQLGNFTNRWNIGICEIYDRREHSSLGQNPRNAYTTGISLGGRREMRRIEYDEIFLILTLPSPAQGTTRIVQPSRGVKIGNIWYWCDAFRDPEIEKTAVDASSVWEWCQGKTIPQLLIILRICYCLGISLTDFLIVTNDLTTRKVTPLLNSQYSQTIQRFEIEQIQILLSAYLEKNPPDSVEKIAQYLQQDKRDLSRHFPDICYEIAKRNQKYRSELSHQRIQKLCSQARSAAIELAVLGVDPSDSRVQAHLNWKGHMKNQKIRDVLTLVRCELGFD